ncbi:hypothetical protein [Streptomyces sp. NPDC058272]|uniref:DUF7848 domain-containing protein n=1 Tax=Streptomyces sp. NPDC058272 TaxID=3346415 RepID=UPI0036E840FF
MTSAHRDYAYPEVSTRATIDDLPVRRWVECAGCIEWQDIEHTTEAEVWTEEHLRRNPSHDRFRVVRQTGWRLVPTAEEAEPPAP